MYLKENKDIAFVETCFENLGLGTVFRTRTDGLDFMRIDDIESDSYYCEDRMETFNAVYLVDGELTVMSDNQTVFVQKDTLAEETNLTNNINKSRGEKKMKDVTNMMGINFEFGKVPNSIICMSISGLAFRGNDGRYSTYNILDNTLTDVTEMLFEDMGDMIFQMPCAFGEVKRGDIIKHQNEYAVITAIKTNSFDAVLPFKHEKVEILPSRNMFGFNYVTKVVNLFENMNLFGGSTPSAENPFGNIMPMMMMSQIMSDGEGDGMFGGGMFKMMMMSQMMGGGQNMFANMFNPQVAENKAE